MKNGHAICTPVNFKIKSFEINENNDAFEFIFCFNEIGNK